MLPYQRFTFSITLLIIITDTYSSTTDPNVIVAPAENFLRLKKIGLLFHLVRVRVMLHFESYNSQFGPVSSRACVRSVLSPSKLWNSLFTSRVCAHSVTSSRLDQLNQPYYFYLVYIALNQRNLPPVNNHRLKALTGLSVNAYTKIHQVSCLNLTNARQNKPSFHKLGFPNKKPSIITNLHYL